MPRDHFSVHDLEVELAEYASKGLCARPVRIQTEHGQHLEIIDIWYEGSDGALTILARPIVKAD